MNSIKFLWIELKQLEKRPFAVILTAAFCLIGASYFSSASRIVWSLPLFRIVGLTDFYDQLSAYFFIDDNANLWRLVYWAVITIFFYLIIPAGVIIFIFKESLNTYGLKQKDMFNFSGVYLLLFICIFPAVFVASFTVDFQNTYPYFSPINLKSKIPYLLVWECFYVVQFFAVEFFFRGFMIHGLKKQLGISSVWVMVMPYCMIHFGKPLPECVGSIFAGIVLGVMSYRTGSIWLGAAIHIAVALSMDLLSLFHKGIIF